MFSLSIFICVFKARCDFDSISCTKEKHSVMFFFQRIFLLWFFQSSLRVFFINESYRTIEIKICHYISNVLIASTVKLPNNLNPITITFFISKDLKFLPKWLNKNQNRISCKNLLGGDFSRNSSKKRLNNEILAQKGQIL